MTTSLFNFEPLPNADLIAKVIEHTRAINQAYIDAIDAQKSKVAEQAKSSVGLGGADPGGGDGVQAVDKTSGRGVIA